MCEEDQYMMAWSRYQFNLDRIAERYCNASNRRELAYEALERDFGDASISSPVVELKDGSNTEVCERLNEDFENEYGKRILLKIINGNRNAGRSISDDEELRNYYSNHLFDGQFDCIGKYASEFIERVNNGSMMTNCIEEGPYGGKAKKPRKNGPTYDRVIDMITSPVKEGPIKIRTNNKLTKSKNSAGEQSSSDEGQLTRARDETFLHSWFYELGQYCARANFIQDRSFRSRAAHNARRSAYRNLGYVNMADQ
ncbi:unnamed protein product [Cercopithifilaria johnstoni]|uniref:Uncharacterized protein n=1 Tax=Cercopithifilaria johnstoni TaxID=2874296 RepID=A0A8J2Q0X7_9BILA|nr:unnamed protein product [Cercopithifilaria johnstoni]